MGFMKDIKKLSDQSKALEKKYPVQNTLAIIAFAFVIDACALANVFCTGYFFSSALP